MMDVIDKPPVVGAPPALPPFLNKRRGEEPRRFVIIPNMLAAAQHDLIISPANNWKTMIYRWMLRIEVATGMAESAHISARRYRVWLETYDMDNDIAPHICFGGPVEPLPIGDPEFYSRWVKYAQETFW